MDVLGLHFKVADFIGPVSNGTAKMNLAKLAFLCYGGLVRNPIVRDRNECNFLLTL